MSQATLGFPGQPTPVPIKTHTCVHGCAFHGYRWWVFTGYTPLATSKLEQRHNKEGILKLESRHNREGSTLIASKWQRYDGEGHAPPCRIRVQPCPVTFVCCMHMAWPTRQHDPQMPHCVLRVRTPTPGLIISKERNERRCMGYMLPPHRFQGHLWAERGGVRRRHVGCTSPLSFLMSFTRQLVFEG